MRADREIFSLNNFIRIMQECRAKLIRDVINHNPDLYRVLYSEDDKNVQDLYKKRYELGWLEMHWIKCKNMLDDETIHISTRKEVLRIFLQWYQKFVTGWGYTSSDVFFFNAHVESLGILIRQDSEWKKTLDELNISFIREKKILDKKIQEAIKNGSC